MSVANNLIEQIKKAGFQVGLESELTARMTQMKAAKDDGNWAYVHSHAVVIAELADELQKVTDKKKV